MPRYQVDLQYLMQNEYWTNKFYITVSSLSGAELAVDSMVVALRPALSALVTIDKARITPLPFVKNTFTDYVIGLPGTRMVTPPGPLFTVVRWDTAADTGRTSHHYIRGGILPTDFGSNGNFTADAQGFNNGIIGTFNDGTFVWTDIHGTPLTKVRASPKVGMRQMRRGSRRRQQPVI